MTQPSNHSPLLHPEWQTIEKILNHPARRV